MTFNYYLVASIRFSSLFMNNDLMSINTRLRGKQSVLLLVTCMFMCSATKLSAQPQLAYFVVSEMSPRSPVSFSMNGRVNMFQSLSTMWAPLSWKPQYKKIGLTFSATIYPTAYGANVPVGYAYSNDTLSVTTDNLTNGDAYFNLTFYVDDNVRRYIRSNPNVALSIYPSANLYLTNAKDSLNSVGPLSPTGSGQSMMVFPTTVRTSKIKNEIFRTNQILTTSGNALLYTADTIKASVPSGCGSNYTILWQQKNGKGAWFNCPASRNGKQNYLPEPVLGSDINYSVSRFRRIVLSACSNDTSATIVINYLKPFNFVSCNLAKVLCADANGNYLPLQFEGNNPKINNSQPLLIWQQSSSPKGAWTTLPNSNDSLVSYTLSKITAKNLQSNVLYVRRIVSQGGQNDTSNVVELNFMPPGFSPNIEIQVLPSRPGQLNLLATLKNAVANYSVQWIPYANNESPLTPVSGNYFSFTLPNEMDIQKVRSQVNYGPGCPIFSSREIVITSPDGNGNIYGAVNIAGKNWLMSNVRATRFNDGTPIQTIQNKTNQSWASYLWYNSDSAANALKYGALYNLTVIRNGNQKNVCPAGYRVANYFDWIDLFESLGGLDSAANKLKLSGAWSNSNNGANAFNFSATPGGELQTDFVGKKAYGAWWGVYEGFPYNDPQIPVFFKMAAGVPAVYKMQSKNYESLLNNFFSIRCIQ